MDYLNSVPLPLIIVLSALFIALIVGLIIQRKIIPRLRKRYARSQNANLRIFWATIQGPVFIWIVLGTLYGLGRYFQIPQTNPIGEIYANALLILELILLITFTYVMIQLSRNLLKYNIRKGRLPNTTIFSSISNITIIIFGATLVLLSLGINISPLVAAFGIGGLAVALALQPTLANLFAGVSIIASKQINPGDFVQLSVEESGYIEDIQWRTTSIRTLQNNLIIIPNSTLSNLTLTNYSLPQRELSLHINLGVHYDSDLDKVREVCLEVARYILQNEEGAVRDFEPVVRFMQFGPSSIDIRVVLRINEFTQQFHIRSEFIRILRRRFKEENITIPYPITTVEFADKGTKSNLDPSEFS